MVQLALIALMAGIAAGTSFRVAFVVPLVAFGAAIAAVRGVAAGPFTLAADVFLIAALIQAGYLAGAYLLELASRWPATAARGPRVPSRLRRG